MKKLDLGIKKYDLGIKNRKSIFNFNDFKGLGMFKDTDGDGRINILDCDPLNPKKQHLRKSIRDRIKKLPIYIGTKEYNPDEEDPEKIAKQRFHVLSKKAKQLTPGEREMMLSILNKYPNIVSDVEKSKVREVVYTQKQKGYIKRIGGYLGGEAIPDPYSIDDFEEDKEPGGVAVIYSGSIKPKDLSKGRGFIKRKAYRALRGSETPYGHKEAMRRAEEFASNPGKEIREKKAEAMAHELQHVKQFRKISRANVKNPEQGKRLHKRYFTGAPYRQLKSEEEAYDRGAEAIRETKRKTYGARKYATRQFVRTMDQEEPTDVRNQDMGLI